MAAATTDHRWLAGAFTAVTTPFTPDGSAVDEDKLIEQIAFQANPHDPHDPNHSDNGVHGIVVLGTTGESPTITDREARLIAERSIAHGRSLGLRIIIGAGSNNTAHAVELQKQAARMGADATLSVVPYYNKPMQEGLYRHFMMVADAADIPVMLYNIPGRSGVALTIDTIERLSRHPNIAALKHATGSVDEASRICARCEDLILLSGDDPLTWPLASVGITGAVSVIGNILPGRLRALIDAIHHGDWRGGQQIHFELAPLAAGLMSLATNPIGIKTAMRLLGRDSGVLRLPLTESDDAITGAVRELLVGAGLL
ncbi:MAG: 4-hydroxy-tetrahydrodipicolinate synthase [Phycisphaerales bacterium]|nr:4-hydroxy-tetrahydrodipicolinate synthase [Phycisphaerales bacterium]